MTCPIDSLPEFDRGHWDVYEPCDLMKCGECAAEDGEGGVLERGRSGGARRRARRLRGLGYTVLKENEAASGSPRLGVTLISVTSGRAYKVTFNTLKASMRFVLGYTLLV